MLKLGGLGWLCELRVQSMSLDYQQHLITKRAWETIPLVYRISNVNAIIRPRAEQRGREECLISYHGCVCIFLKGLESYSTGS
jgi:hypothetical protein